MENTHVTFWTTLLISGSGAYAGICMVFYFFQHYFFFRPEILPRQFVFHYPFPFEEVDFSMEDGGQINALLFKVPNSRGVVLYFKGNSRSLKGWGKFAKDFVGKGYDFFIFDYRGFGKSSGKRTENILYNDAQIVYKWVSDRYPEDKIIIYGRSLGSGIAARIASWNKPRMLILDAPYFSFLHQIKRFGFFLPLSVLLRYQIRTDRFLRKATCPVFIIHGNQDRLIPHRHGQMLHEMIPEKSALITIQGAHHNNLPEFAGYHEALYDLLNDDDYYWAFRARMEGRADAVQRA
jgi:fermentation-respiration switch protein FrsA (DUF1100 family)